MIRPDAVFRWTREPERAWVDALAAVSPRSDAHSHLILAWIAGSHEQPAQRWGLWEVTPKAFIPPDLLDELNGPDPRVLNADGIVRTIITREQWDLYRVHDGLARLFWVIQGDRGGHKYRFTSQESRLLEMQKLRKEPPYIGEWPYAPFDHRALKAVLKFDRLMALRGDLKALRQQNSASGFTQQMRDADKAFRAELVSWLSDQVAEPADAFMHSMRNGVLEGRSSGVDFVKADEIATEQYIEHGTVPLLNTLAA